jgi:hypothetical protein
MTGRVTANSTTAAAIRCAALTRLRGRRLRRCGLDFFFMILWGLLGRGFPGFEFSIRSGEAYVKKARRDKKKLNLDRILAESLSEAVVDSA